LLRDAEPGGVLPADEKAIFTALGPVLRIVTRRPSHSPQSLRFAHEFGDAVHLDLGGRTGEARSGGVVVAGVPSTALTARWKGRCPAGADQARG